MAQPKKRIPMTPNTGSEEVPPGATREAFDRDWDPRSTSPDLQDDSERGGTDSPGGLPHDGLVDDPNVDPTIPGDAREDTGYGGPSGGAVGGTPAEKRSEGGNVERGIAPGGDKRGDSTVGADPSAG